MSVYRKVGLSFVLCFVGAKMLIVDIHKIPIGVSSESLAGFDSLCGSLALGAMEGARVLLSRLGLERFAAQATGAIARTLQAHPCWAKFGY